MMGKPMKETFKRFIFRLNIINHKVEFLVILTWMLLCPSKQSYFYFLSTAGLLCFFSIRNIVSMKTLGVSKFNYSLPLVGLMLSVSLFFSVYHLNSILFFSDLLLICCYFFLFYNPPDREAELILVLGYIISFFSLVTTLGNIIPLPFLKTGGRHTFFAGTIPEGIISGIGVLIIIYFWLHRGQLPPVRKKNKKHYPGKPPAFAALNITSLLIINIAGVFVSQSKAAYLGTVIFVLLLLLLKKRKWIPILALLVVLTFIIPNPIRAMFYRTIYKDPYALERLNIWKMCVTIIKDYPLTGVGFDNFKVVTVKYNFKQKHAPANYVKRAGNTHNDYLQLLVETGLAGFLILAFLFYRLSKKLFSSSLFNIHKILLLYLLFQAFLFNILFTTFFFFLLVYLLRNILEGEVAFKSFSIPLKAALTCFLVFVLGAAYFLPWLSDNLAGKAQEQIEEPVIYELLNRSLYFNPLNAAIYYSKALTLKRFFTRTSSTSAFYSALEQVEKAQRLNPYYIDAYQLEADLYLEILNKQVQLEFMDRDIIAVLERAEHYAPSNPFIKLTKARVYLQFEKPEKARLEAMKAIALEPDFLEAITFLHRGFNYIPDEVSFQKRVDDIRSKARSWDPRPGTYLHRIFSMPN